MTTEKSLACCIARRANTGILSVTTFVVKRSPHGSACRTSLAASANPPPHLAQTTNYQLNRPPAERQPAGCIRTWLASPLNRPLHTSPPAICPTPLPSRSVRGVFGYSGDLTREDSRPGLGFISPASLQRRASLVLTRYHGLLSVCFHVCT